MALNRKQPTVNSQKRVQTTNPSQEAKTKRESTKKKSSKFNSGIDLEAIFGAISQLLETFTSQSIEYNGVNASLALRTIYRNLDDDMIAILSEEQNVEALNNYLKEKNQEIADAYSETSKKQEEQPTPQVTEETEPRPEQPSEPLEPTVTENETTTVEPIEETTTSEDIELPPTERTEELEPIEVEGETTKSESETKTVKETESKIDLKNVTQTQKLCATGEIDPENLDVFQVARDFIAELVSDAWKMNRYAMTHRQGLENSYEIYEEIKDDDEQDENFWRWAFWEHYNRTNENRQHLTGLLDEQQAQGENAPMAKPESENPVEETPPVEQPHEQPQRQTQGQQEQKTEEGQPQEQQTQPQQTQEQPQPKKKPKLTFKSIIRKILFGETLEEKKQREAQEQAQAKQGSEQKPEATGEQKQNKTYQNNVRTYNLPGKKITEIDDAKLTLGQAKRTINDNFKHIVKVSQKTKVKTVVKKERFSFVKLLKMTRIKNLLMSGIPEHSLIVVPKKEIDFKNKQLKLLVLGGKGFGEKKGPKGKSGQLNKKAQQRKSRKPKKTPWGKFKDNVAKSHKRNVSKLTKFLRKKKREVIRSFNKKRKNITKAFRQKKREVRKKYITPLKRRGRKLLGKVKKSFLNPKKTLQNLKKKIFKPTKKSGPKGKIPTRKPSNTKQLRTGKSTAAVTRRRRRRRTSMPPRKTMPATRTRRRVGTGGAKGITKKDFLNALPRKPKGAGNASRQPRGAPAAKPPAIPPKAKAPKSTTPSKKTKSAPARSSKAKGSLPAKAAKSDVKQNTIKTVSDVANKARKSRKSNAPAKGGGAKGKGRGKKSNLVAVPGKQIDSAKKLGKQAKGGAADGKKANAASKNKPGSLPPSANANVLGSRKPKPKAEPLGRQTARAKMEPAEAFHKNILEGMQWLNEKLYNNKPALKKMSLPEKDMSRALANIMNPTSKIAEQMHKDLNGIEEQVNDPNERQGLFKKILLGIGKFLLIGIGAMIVIRLFRSAVYKWVPRGKDDKIMHGAKIGPITLPNMMDIFIIGKAMFYMIKNTVQRVWFNIKKIIRWVKRDIIGKWSQHKKFIIGLAKGFIAGVIAKNVARFAGAVTSIAQLLNPGLGIGIDITVQALIAAFFALRALRAELKDRWNSWKKKKQEQANKTHDSFKPGAMQRNMGDMVSMAKKIKPLVPIENIMTGTKMDDKSAAKKGLPKTIIPAGVHFNLDKRTADNEQKASRNATEVKEKKKALIEKDYSKYKGATFRGESLRDLIQGSYTAGKRIDSRRKIVMLAAQQTKKLLAARKRVARNFVKQTFWRGNPNIKDWIIKKTGKWNPKYLYTGKNAIMLKSQIPTTPFGPVAASPIYPLGKVYANDQMGILPFSFQNEAGEKFAADINEWERYRIREAIRLWTNLIIGMNNLQPNIMTGFSGMFLKSFMKFKSKLDKQWVEMSMTPNWHSRLSIAAGVEKWNAWHEKEYRKKMKKAKRQQRKEKLIAGVNAAAARLFGKQNLEKIKKFVKGVATAAKKVAKAAKTITKAAANIVLFAANPVVFIAVKGIKAFIKWRKKPKKPPQYSHGNKFIRKQVYKTSPMMHLGSRSPKTIIKALNIDSWWKAEPPKHEKIYHKGAGKIAYNILLSLGFKYDRNVWRNPKFLKVRHLVISQVANSVNMYINNVLIAYRRHLLALLAFGRKHRSKEAQDQILTEAGKTVLEFDEARTYPKFLEFFAKNFKPTDYHLVIRDKKGKIIKEEGKELKAFEVPDEIYNTDPALWDKVTDGMDNPMPGEKAGWFKLRVQRNKLSGGLKWIIRRNKEIKKLEAAARKSLAVAADMGEKAKNLFKIGMIWLNLGVKRAKRKIKRYYREQQLKLMFKTAFLMTPFGMAFFVLKSVGKFLFKKIFKFGKWMLGHKDIRKTFNKAIRALSRAKAIVSNVAQNAKQKIEKLANNDKLAFLMLNKKRMDEKELNIQQNAEAEKMRIREQERINEKVDNIMKLADEKRKNDAKEQKKTIKGYWQYLKQKWEDRLSEKTMDELKGTTANLSNNLMDYMNLVNELPEGNLVIVNNTTYQQGKTYRFMPDIAF